MSIQIGSLPQVASREEWLVARKELLAKEKALTRKRDALNAERRMLPMVQIDKDYVLEGPDGEASLLDLFDGHRQLIVQHFMFDPSWDDGCPSCSWAADEISTGRLEHLNEGNTMFVTVSRAPIGKIEDYKARRGWTFPWYSSYGSDFNYDFSFLRVGDDVFHTYSTYARGTETIGGAHYLLDLTALGRQEEWEEPNDRVVTSS